jgi:CRISPR-associated protein Csm4
MIYEKLKLLIKFETPFLTPLQSDTLFGEFCWTFSYCYGEERLNGILSTKTPGIAFSDGIPDGYLPIPLFPMKNISLTSERATDKAKKLYEGLKEFKKKRYVLKELLLSSVSEGELLTEELFKEFQKLNEKERNKKFLSSYATATKTVHVSIDRLTGTSKEGMLFQSTEFFAEREIAIYVFYNPEVTNKEEIFEVFQVLGTVGFGAKKSWGKGKFIVRIVDYDLPDGNSDFFISLSTGLPAKEEVKSFYAEFFTKYPKHGREIARPEIFKNPLILSKPGAVFYPEEKKELYGSLVSLSVEENHLHSTLVIPLFVEKRNGVN